MSIAVSIDTLTSEQKQKIKTDLMVKEILSKSAPSFAQPAIYRDFFIDGNTRTIYIPYFYAKKEFNLSPPDKPTTHLKFNGELRDYQIEPVNKVVYNLKTHGSAILSANCGFGKTITSLYCAAQVGGPIAIVLHLKSLFESWKEALKLLSTEENGGDLQIDIISIHILKNYSRDELSKYRTVIIDEVHVIGAESFTEATLKFTPSYLLGLSATPTRVDGLDIILHHHFNKEYITSYKKLKDVTVQAIYTGITPEYKTNKNGDIDWCSIVNYLAESEELNNKIIDKLLEFPDKRFMILCARKTQVEILMTKADENDIDATSYYGSMKVPKNPAARVLIGTTSKMGVGFDDTTRNALILASDVAAAENLEQFTGRVIYRTKDVPLIIDYIHNFPSLKRHWTTRKKFYEKIEADVIISGKPSRQSAIPKNSKYTLLARPNSAKKD